MVQELLQKIDEISTVYKKSEETAHLATVQEEGKKPKTTATVQEGQITMNRLFACGEPSRRNSGNLFISTTYQKFWIVTMSNAFVSSTNSR